MKYKCCNLIQHGLCFFCNDLVSCCFSPNDQIENGHPPMIIPDYKGELLSKDFLFKRIDEKIQVFKQNDCLKECLNCYHLEEKEWDEEPYLNYITITHFSVCNADCIYCTNNFEQNERTNDVYEILPVLRNLKEQGIIKEGVELHIGGGEFTIYKECDALLEEFAMSGFANVYIPTNAIRFSEKLELAIKKGYATIIVSLDAGTKKTYYKIKRVDAFDRVVENLKKYMPEIIKRREISIKYIVIPTINDNITEFKKFLNIVKEIGVEHIIIDLDARYSRELNHNVEQTLIAIVQKFEKIAKRKGFTTETYSFYTQCKEGKTSKDNIVLGIINNIKYKYFNKTAKKLYSNKIV